jgi:hypothetical protein
MSSYDKVTANLEYERKNPTNDFSHERRILSSRTSINVHLRFSLVIIQVVIYSRIRAGGGRCHTSMCGRRGAVRVRAEKMVTLMGEMVRLGVCRAEEEGVAGETRVAMAGGHLYARFPGVESALCMGSI